MSDIQEEQKRLYKRAEENDIKLLQDRIDKAISYIEEAFEEDEINCGNIYHTAYDDLYMILKGDNK